MIWNSSPSLPATNIGGHLRPSLTKRRGAEYVTSSPQKIFHFLMHISKNICVFSYILEKNSPSLLKRGGQGESLLLK